MESVKIIEKSIIDYSHEILVSIFIDFPYNQSIVSILIGYYRLAILSIEHAGQYKIYRFLVAMDDNINQHTGLY